MRRKLYIEKVDGDHVPHSAWKYDQSCKSGNCCNRRAARTYSFWNKLFLEERKLKNKKKKKKRVMKRGKKIYRRERSPEEEERSPNVYIKKYDPQGEQKHWG